MREQPEASAFHHIIQHEKGPGTRRDGLPRQYRVEIHPMAFTYSEKPGFRNLTIDRRLYSGGPSLDPMVPQPSLHNLVRSMGEEWLYLLNKNARGYLICRTRGKLMVLAAGNHALVVNFAVDASIIGMPVSVYDEIISQVIPGPNLSPKRAEIVRSFVIPERFKVEGSSPVTPRTINIFAAFISDDWVWTICDSTRLVRMHIISRDQPWKAEDFELNSPSWPSFFEPFKGGPDWVSERTLAERALDKWRKKTLALYQSWQDDSTHMITNYFHVTSLNQVPPRPKPPKSIADRSILCDIYSNSHRAFSGFGPHTANDFLYQIALFPGTPSYIICLDDRKYTDFKVSLHTYMAQFYAPEFLSRVASVANDNNPFAFQGISNLTYTSSYTLVFRRTSVKVPRDLYNRYASLGLLDPEHIIGQPYLGRIDLCKRTKRKATVYLVHGALKFYTIIRAETPDGWDNGRAEAVEKDMTEDGHPTLGIAQTEERLLNRVDPKNAVSARGRPSMIHTGKPGRPARAKPPRKVVVKANKPRRTVKASSSRLLAGVNIDRESHTDDEESSSDG
ncbi:hypothetical protein Hypma_008475 [Hypsizygus marmoreus]|uniref:Uncharacterized protein n=1 Tax=Hypsizygus marmoreus TaxID=39966 RepID=A0A369K0E3_HYPMA|nr:hypothetical protein Hypma_008475 [Hypsizygus marmoreus]